MKTPRIVSNRAIMAGKPVIEGTRLTVELILEKLAEGRTEEELLMAYPRLTKEAIRVALSYAANALRSDQLYPIHFIG